MKKSVLLLSRNSQIIKSCTIYLKAIQKSLVLFLVLIVILIPKSSHSQTCTTPAKPTGLKATTVSSSEIDLSWSSVSGAIGYDISYCDGTYIAFSSTTSYKHTGRASSTNYSYKIQAQKSATCVSGYTSCVSATTQSSCTAPSKPTSLTATSVSSSEIDLSWSSVSGAIGYDISYCDGTYIAFSS